MRQPGMSEPPAGTLAMTGPLDADFVAQANARVRPVDPSAVLLMRFFRRRR